MRIQHQKGERPGGLTTTNLVMMGIGNIIGAGLFVGSGIAVKQAGPSVVLAFIVGAVAFIGVLSFIAEMATAKHSPGGLRDFAYDGLGPWMGFTIGWMYWSSGVLTMASEVTAAALLAHAWLPWAPLWTLSLAFSLFITAINFLDTRGFGRVEGWLSVGKVVALAGFVLIGGYFLTRGGGAGWHALRTGGPGLGGLFPTGLWGFGASLLLVMNTYAGVQVIGMAAAETRDPSTTIPRSIRSLTSSVIALYLGGFAVLVAVLPWNQIHTGLSPFAQALGGLGLPGVQTILNLVVLTAALSALNSSLFGVSRMLRALAVDGEAPAIFRGKTRQGTPSWALAGSSLMLLVAIVLSYVLPHSAYLIVTSACGFLSMINWAVITLSYMRLHPVLRRQHGDKLVYQAPGYPYLPLATLAISVAVMLTTPLNPGQTVGLVVGAVQFALVSLIYLVAIRPRRKAPEPTGDRVVTYEPEAPASDDRLRT